MNNNKTTLIQLCAKFKITNKIYVTLIMLLMCFMPKINAQQPNEQQQLARHVMSLNELTERRRTNRLFQNEQTPLHGQAIYYTNVGKGNSSLVMRDMVLLSRLPIEYSTTFICVSLPNSPNAIESIYLTSSFSAGEAQDPCKVNQYLDRSEEIKGVGHTHPYFTSAAQYHAGVGCFGDQQPVTTADLNMLNIANKHFSDGDRDAHPLFKVDAYLGTPLRDAVRYMRKGSLVEGTL